MLSTTFGPVLGGAQGASNIFTSVLGLLVNIGLRDSNVQLLLWLNLPHFTLANLAEDDLTNLVG